MATYVTLRRECKIIIKSLDRQNKCELSENFINDPSKFWAYVSHKRKSNAAPLVFFENGRPISD